MNKFRLMIWKEFKHIQADELTIRLMIFPVLLQVFILGYALVTEIKNTPIMIFDASKSIQSQSLIQHIQYNNLFKFKGMLRTQEEGKDYIQRGNIKIAVIIPENFEISLTKENGASIELLVDGQDANSANIASGYIQSIISIWSTNYLKSSLKKQGIQISQVIPIRVNSVVLFNPMLKSTWYMVPALVVLLVTMITGLLTGLSVVKEKEKGTLEQLMVTPVAPIHIIIGKTVPYMIIGTLELCLFLVIATLWFGIPFKGNILTFILFGIIYMVSSLGIGIFTSTIARTPQQVLFLIWFILIFFILLSGFFIPVENMPNWVQKLTYINPVRFFMAAVRALFLKGSSIIYLWQEGLTMMIIGVTVFGASVLFFHRKST